MAGKIAIPTPEGKSKPLTVEGERGLIAALDLDELAQQHERVAREMETYRRDLEERQRHAKPLVVMRLLANGEISLQEIPMFLTRSFYSADVIAEAKSVPIQELAERYGVQWDDKHRRNGSCPICKDGSRRFRVDPVKNVFACSHCTPKAGSKVAGGDTIAFVMAVEGINFIDAIEKLTNRKPDQQKPSETENSTRADVGCIMPVPSDAPRPNFHHNEHGDPVSWWPYRDASGALLFYMLRFNTPKPDDLGEKQFLATLSWRDNGELGWRWRQVPKPWPLDNLDQLAGRPGASVIVCEGEKSADAAAKIFPGHICITSPHGAESARHADWRPLVGRDVWIWPDADDRGDKYAQGVAASLKEISHEFPIMVIDAMAIAAIDPNHLNNGGASRPVEKGWDAADAFVEWKDNLGALHDIIATAHLRPLNVEIEGPIRLFESPPEPAAYPIDALGETLSRTVRAIAGKVQVPLAMAAQSVLAVASLACSGHADVKLPYGQCRPLSLYLATAADCDRKTTSDNEALRPIVEWEKTLRDQHKDDLKEWRIMHSAWSAEKRRIENDRKIDVDERRARLERLGTNPSRL